MDGPQGNSAADTISWQIHRSIQEHRQRLRLPALTADVVDWLHRFAVAWSVQRATDLLDLAKLWILAEEATAVSVDLLRRCLRGTCGKTQAAMVELAMPASKPGDEDEEEHGEAL